MKSGYQPLITTGQDNRCPDGVDAHQQDRDQTGQTVQVKCQPTGHFKHHAGAHRIAEAFLFFADAHNLEAITPPFLHFSILTPGHITMGVGTIIDYQMRLYGLTQRWRTRIEEWEPPHRFVDVQVRGPYRYWHHTHSFRSIHDDTLMLDRVEYEMPFGPIGWIAHALVVRRTLEKIFDYRRSRVDSLFSPASHGCSGG